jgi:hypothetical protein
LNPVLARSHPASSREERVLILESTVHIATDTINNRTSNASEAGVLCHDIAPDCTVSATTIVDDYYIADGHIVNEIANTSWWVTGASEPANKATNS